jgi:hypothetical protein
MGRKPLVDSAVRATAFVLDTGEIVISKNLSAVDHDTLLARAQPLVPFTEPSFIIYEDESFSHKIERAAHRDEMVDSKKPLADDSTTLPKLFLENYIPKEKVDTRTIPCLGSKVSPACKGPMHHLTWQWLR